MKVTKQLGYRYLWVDMFCIDLDPTTKHNQIARMDIFYRCADVTIIAAAGKDANYGLPGVSKARKNRQSRVTIGDATFVSTLRHLPEVVKRPLGPHVVGQTRKESSPDVVGYLQTTKSLSSAQITNIFASLFLSHICLIIRTHSSGPWRMSTSISFLLRSNNR
jgi:hypothetical protein